MSIEILTAPANDAVSLAEYKSHVRVEDSDSDSDLTIKIEAAIKIFERLTNRALITQTVIQKFDKFPCERNFLLERTPVQSITTVKYYDQDNTLTTFDSANYSTSGLNTTPRIFLKKSKEWPTDAHLDRPDAVEVTYICGEGDESTDVSQEYRHAIMTMAGDFMNFREDSLAAPGLTIQSLPLNSQRIISLFKYNFYEWASQSRKS